MNLPPRHNRVKWFGRKSSKMVHFRQKTSLFLQDFISYIKIFFSILRSDWFSKIIIFLFTIFHQVSILRNKITNWLIYRDVFLSYRDAYFSNFRCMLERKRPPPQTKVWCICIIFFQRHIILWKCFDEIEHWKQVMHKKLFTNYFGLLFW